MLQKLAFNFLISALRVAFKNPAKAAELRSNMLELYGAIKTVYADDPEFQ